MDEDASATATTGIEEELSSLKRQLAAQERRYRLLDSQLHLLERERQKLAAMVHHADAGFVVFDVEGRVGWTNGYFVRGFGHDCHPASFTRSSCHQAICGRTAPCEGCPVARTLRSAKVAHHEIELAFDGAERTVYLSAMPIVSMTGEIAEVMVMLQDLSELQVLRRAKVVAATPAKK